MRTQNREKQRNSLFFFFCLKQFKSSFEFFRHDTVYKLHEDIHVMHHITAKIISLQINIKNRRKIK
jgi:hypothetical protein